MNIDKLNDAIGQIDFDLVEAADKAGKKAKVTAFKPWLKWTAAAVAIVIFAVGMPIALNMMGVFKSDNIVAPGSDNSGSSSEDDRSGAVTPIDSNSDTGEPESSSTPDSEAEPASNSGAKPPRSVSASQGSAKPSEGESSSAQSGEHTKPETPVEPTTPPDEPPPEPTEGEFIKEDMPAVTFRIGGEEKMFSYQSSTCIKRTADTSIDGSDGNYVIDYYVDNDGGTIIKSEDSESLIRYEKSVFMMDMPDNERISEREAIEIAEYIVINTDLPIGEFNYVTTSVRYSFNRYYVSFITSEGSVEICLDKLGGLQYLSVKKDALQQVSQERIKAARENMLAEIEILNNSETNGKYVFFSMYLEEWGDKVYAVFDVLYYPDSSSDEHSVPRFYCAV